jgi:hypothetical protein
MTKSRYRYRDARGRDVDEAEALENGILRDGFAVSTGMYMMDATQRSIATHLHDGHGGGIGHRPGHIVSGASEALDARRRMYDEYDARKATEYLGHLACAARRKGIRESKPVGFSSELADPRNAIPGLSPSCFACVPCCVPFCLFGLKASF